MQEKLLSLLGGLLACVVGLFWLYASLGADSWLFRWLFKS